MFTVREVTTPVPGWELTDTASGSSATVCHQRGALVSRWSVGGRERLYLDEATLVDPAKNVRGGIPVLFPSPGKLKDDRYQRGRAQGHMGQHGFARTRGWTVVRTAAESRAELALALEPDEATRAAYPFEFHIELTFALTGSSLEIASSVANRGGEVMPFGLGFHPYFQVPDSAKASARIETDATRAWDNVARREVELRGPIDLTAKEVDLHLLDHRGSASALRWQSEDASPSAIRLEGSSEFTRWVVWTLAGRDFVCLEPWTCPGNALNTGEGLIELPPGQGRRLDLRLTASR